MSIFTISSKKKFEYPLIGKDAYIVFFGFALAYFVSYSFRSINAVITPELTNDLKLTSTQLGLLTSAYFIGFGCTQIPVGVCLDRFGPRITESALMTLAAIGSLLFCFSTGFVALLLGRALIGMGVSACLMSALSGFRSWYTLDKQPQLASAILIFGTSGALLTSSPARTLLPYIGWRGIFLFLAILTMIAIFAALVCLPKKERFSEKVLQTEALKKNSDSFLWSSYKEIIRNHFFLRLLPIGAISLGGFMAIQTLWLGPWLINVMGHTSDSAADIIFWFNTSLLVAYMANTLFLPKFQKIGINTLLYVKLMAGASIFLQFFAFISITRWSLFFWYLYAATSAAYVLAHSLVISSFPKFLSGRVSTTFNIAIFVGAALIQWGIGVLIDVGEIFHLSKKDSFGLSMGIFLAIQLIGFIWFLVGSRFILEKESA